MHCFVTGATGFIGFIGVIGKRLVKTLLARRGSTVSFLLRPESDGKVAGRLEYRGLSGAAASKRALPVFGDLRACEQILHTRSCTPNGADRRCKCSP